MGRITGRQAYGHSIRRIGPGCYRLSWSWDRKYEGSRLRFPQTMHRDTDEAGALRFAEKWGVVRPASGIEAGAAKTEGLGAKPESPAA